MACQSSSLAAVGRRGRAVAALATVCLAVSVAAQAQPSIVADQDREVLATVRTRAQAGVAVAQFTLGSVLHYGGFDANEAASWIRRAAESGYAPAQFELGQMHQFGVGVPPSEDRALEWYRRAAEAGVAAAQRVVGDFYRHGRGGVVADDRQAAEWYRRAADGDDIRAQYYLGQMYMDGQGVRRDYGAAYLWFAVAAGQTPLPDNRKALVELRNIAAARLPPEAVDAAAERVAAWRPQLWN